MALSNATITYDLSDQVGVDFDARRTKVWVTTNVPGDTIVDTVGNKIRLGDGLGTIAEDGTGSVSVWVPGTGSNPASWQTTIHVDYAQRRPGATRVQKSFGPFTIVGDADLSALVDEQEVPPTFLGAAVAELQGYVDQARDISNISTSDDVMTAVAADAGSDFYAVQSATSAAQIAPNEYVSGMTAEKAVVVRSFKTTFYDSFAGKPNHTIVAGELSDSGHPYTVRNVAGAAFEVKNDCLTITQGSTGTTKAGYLGPDLDAEPTDAISLIGAEFSIPSSVNEPMALTLIASLLQFTQASDATTYSVAGCHANLNLDADNLLYQTLNLPGSPFTAHNLARKFFAELARDVRHIFEIAIRDGVAFVTLRPHGLDPIRMVTKLYPDEVRTQNGPWPTIELTALSGATRETVNIHTWWAELESRSESTSPAGSRMDTGLALTQTGRVVAYTKTTGASTLTALTTSTSAVLFSQTAEITRSQKITAKGLIFINRTIPTTQVAANLMIAVECANSSYRKLHCVINDTLTPATATAYTAGMAVPYEVTIDCSAFEIGSVQTFNVRASASASSLFSFVDSGSESGGASSLRHSTLTLTEVA